MIIEDPVVFAEFQSWIVLQRHPTQSILFHPVTNSKNYSDLPHIQYDHIDLAMWVGREIPLDRSFGNCMQYVADKPAPYQKVAEAMGTAKVKEGALIEQLLLKLSSKEQLIVRPPQSKM